MTISSSFLESNSNNSFDKFPLTTLFEDNEGTNQTNRANTQYSVHPLPPLSLQVNNLDI